MVPPIGLLATWNIMRIDRWYKPISGAKLNQKELYLPWQFTKSKRMPIFSNSITIFLFPHHLRFSTYRGEVRLRSVIVFCQTTLVTGGYPKTGHGMVPTRPRARNILSLNLFTSTTGVTTKKKSWESYRSWNNGILFIFADPTLPIPKKFHTPSHKTENTNRYLKTPSL